DVPFEEPNPSGWNHLRWLYEQSPSAPSNADREAPQLVRLFHRISSSAHAALEQVDCERSNPWPRRPAWHCARPPPGLSPAAPSPGAIPSSEPLATLE